MKKERLPAPGSFLLHFIRFSDETYFPIQNPLKSFRQTRRKSTLCLNTVGNSRKIVRLDKAKIFPAENTTSL